jgi:hypothetical protein
LLVAAVVMPAIGFAAAIRQLAVSVPRAARTVMALMALAMLFVLAVLLARLMLLMLTVLLMTLMGRGGLRRDRRSERQHQGSEKILHHSSPERAVDWSIRREGAEAADRIGAGCHAAWRPGAR